MFEKISNSVNVEKEEEGEEGDKENMDDSRNDTSMSNSTLNTTSSGLRVINEKAEVDENGILDLSNLSLTNLSKSFKDEYAQVKYLNINQNEMHFFTYLDMFKNCEKIDASDNQIRKFSSCLNHKLKEIFLSNNQLKSAKFFNRFENLQILDLSANNIEEDVVLHLTFLECLDLSKNNINKLPDVSKCKNIISLNLSFNKIIDLKNIKNLLNSKNLQMFDISSNLINDLSQFSALQDFENLESISLENNPCLFQINFDYRNYIVAICSDSLSKINEQFIETNIKTEGEWLKISGGIKKIEAGNHEKLCDLITDKFPLAGLIDTPTKAQLACQKVLKNRRENRDSLTTNTERTLDSIYSPSQEWNKKLQKNTFNFVDEIDENLKKFKLIKVTPKKISLGSFAKSSESEVNRRAMRMCSPPNSRQNKSKSMFNLEDRIYEASTSTSENKLTRTNSTDSSRTIIFSDRSEANISIERDEKLTPTPIKDDFMINKTNRESDDEMNTSEKQRIPSVTEVTSLDEKQNMEARISKLECIVYNLVEQKENLTTIVENLEDTLTWLANERNEMIEKMRKMIPTPKNLIFKKLENSENDYVVRWEVPVVQEYNILINGKSYGKISGKNNAARITDLDDKENHHIQIQAIASNGLMGDISEKIHINSNI